MSTQNNSLPFIKRMPTPIHLLLAIPPSATLHDSVGFLAAFFWIFAVGLMPPLLSVWMMRRSEARTRARLTEATTVTTRMRTRERCTTPLFPDRYYLEGVGYLIGDISCQFNARSGYLRCTVNPQGPCQDCRHYEPRKVARSERT